MPTLSTPLRVAAYAAGLALAFVAALAVGQASGIEGRVVTPVMHGGEHGTSAPTTPSTGLGPVGTTAFTLTAR